MYSYGSTTKPANTRRWPNVGLMLAHRRQSWLNLNWAMEQRAYRVFDSVIHHVYLWPLEDKTLQKLQHNLFNSRLQ